MEIMALKLEIQNDSIPQDDSFSLPKITNVESVPSSGLRRRRRRPPVVPEEYLRRSARIKERLNKLRIQNSSPQQDNTAQSKRSKPRRPKTTKRNKKSRANNAATNACVQRGPTNTQSATVIWRNVEPSPNLPLVSAPRNSQCYQNFFNNTSNVKNFEKVMFPLKKCRYERTKRCSATLCWTLYFPSSEERSEPSQEGHIKREREETADKEYCERQQTAHMMQIQESSRNDNCLLDIKLE
ncbi:hypothetical protein AVEN_146639-1 [Araneus ventricosus]|uniref:Uncharacterized protein n=1 Tax=Araneus ventricosus TaxID=182803 RepID=A0A4Y2JHJ9_ARAVE|nr:hypothetical protein AVEN_146639-1 [Araneus ventricosus]